MAGCEGSFYGTFGRPQPVAVEAAQVQRTEDGCGGLPLCDAEGARPCCIDAHSRARAQALRLGAQALFVPEHYPNERNVEGIAAKGHEYRTPALTHVGPAHVLAAAEKRYVEGERHSAHDSGFIQTVYRVLSLATGQWGPEHVLCTYRPPDEAPRGLVEGRLSRAGSSLPGTCGNATVGYDSVRRRVVVLANGNDHDLEQGKDTLLFGDRRVLVVRSQPLPADGVVPNDLAFGPPVDVTEHVIGDRRRRWDAIGPGAAVEVSPGRLAFAAAQRTIFVEGDAFSVAPITVAAPQRGGWKPRAAEATMAMRNDGSFVRNGRTAGPFRNPLMPFRRIATFSIPGTNSWTPYTVTGQPFTPAHSCGACGVFDEVCPPAVTKQRERCARKGIRPRGVLLCHAAMARLSAAPDIDRMLFTNPGNSFTRFGMDVRLSYDEGESWPIGRWLVPIEEETLNDKE